MVVLAILTAGCSSSPTPHAATAPPNTVPGSASESNQPPTSNPTPGSTSESDHYVGSTSDTVGSVPGSANALYTYRFTQIEPPSDRFTYQDRDLTFAFRPSPSALYFQVENKSDRPVWIDWDRSQWLDRFGTGSRIANGEARWSQRFNPLATTQIPGLQRYGTYVFPFDLLIDPGSSTEQVRRPLFPEDKLAPQYVDREFGMILVFRVEDRQQAYTFRFKVRSVIPR